MGIDWEVLSKHLFDKAEQFQGELPNVKDKSNAGALMTAALIANTLAKGIQKATSSVATAKGDP
jgi:hypothetical protein